MAGETRHFRMNPKLLLDVMRRQAGSLSKAVLEGVMNSVDAKATECYITTAPLRVTISDDGQGFRNREEIESWFEVFGQPHEESEGKTYGTFRMGRGQMFAFGSNKWRTGKFAMDVDIDNRGLDYDLKQETKNHPGCLIEISLYTKLLPSDLASIERDLSVWVKYCPIPIYLNKELLSSDPEKEKWDHVTPEAFINLKANGCLSVYNLGIHVMDVGGYKYGTGGEVVSRKQLKVNFARNDIQSDCSVWKVVKKIVDQNAATRMTGKKALNDDERQRLVDKLLTGEMRWDEAADLKLITAATGRQYPISALSSVWEWRQLTNAAKGNRKADKLMKGKVAFVIANETLDRFHVKDVKKLLAKIQELDVESEFDWTSLSVVDFNELAKGMSDKYDVLEDKDLSPNEKFWLELIAKSINKLTCTDKDANYRRIQVGVSTSAEGWTDGKSYICIGKEFLSKLEINIPGIMSVGTLLLHEMCHHTPDLEEHDHDQAFYEEFHDNADSVGEFVSMALSYIPRVCEMMKRKMNKVMLQDQDRVIKAEDAIAKFPHVAIRKR